MVTRLRARGKSLGSDSDQPDNREEDLLSRSARLQGIRERIMNRSRIPAMADSSPPPFTATEHVETVTIRLINGVLKEEWNVPLVDMNEVIVSKWWRGDRKEPREVRWKGKPPKFEDVSRDQMAAVLTHVAARDEKHPCLECAQGGVFEECRVKSTAWNRNGRCTSCIFRDEASHNSCSFARAKMGENAAMSTTGVSESFTTTPVAPPPTTTAAITAATAAALQENQQKRKRASLAETPSNTAMQPPAEQPQPEKRKRGRPKRNSMPAAAVLSQQSGNTANTTAPAAAAATPATTGVTTRRRSTRAPRNAPGQDESSPAQMLSASTKRWLNDSSANAENTAEQSSSSTAAPAPTTTAAASTAPTTNSTEAASAKSHCEGLTPAEKERMSQLAKQLEDSSMINIGWIQNAVLEDGDKAKAEIQTVREYLVIAEKLATETGRIRRQVEALETTLKKLTEF
ncbi:hypothetical protein KEM56_004011 [Ascosphaera pollenicola]|nr:hypothetical protein KEM56_004011 [Ascosphaera pollenicola]